MTPAPTTLRSRLTAVGYRLFYRIPHGVRIRLVRLVMPKYIIGAVVLVRDTEAAAPGRLILVRQTAHWYWSLPAGLLRRGEPPAVGAARELAEETGISLGVDRLSPAVPNAVVHAKGWVDVVFEAHLPGSTTTMTVDGAEILEAAWHPVDDLPRITGPTARLLAEYGIGPLAGPPPPNHGEPDHGGPDRDGGPPSASGPDGAAA